MITNLIPQILEKTKSGKITWVANKNSDLCYLSNRIDSNRVIRIEQIMSTNDGNPDMQYFMFLLNGDVCEFVEKVTMGNISSLIKEIRQTHLSQDFKTTLDELTNALNVL